MNFWSERALLDKFGFNFWKDLIFTVLKVYKNNPFLG